MPLISITYALVPDEKNIIQVINLLLRNSYFNEICIWSEMKNSKQNIEKYGRKNAESGERNVMKILCKLNTKSFSIE